MAAAKSMNLSTLFGMIALLVAVLAFGTWYRSTEGFQTQKLPIDQILRNDAGRMKRLIYLANDKKSSSARPDFATAGRNIMKHVDMPAENTPEFIAAVMRIKNAVNDLKNHFLNTRKF